MFHDATLAAPTHACDRPDQRSLLDNIKFIRCIPQLVSLPTTGNEHIDRSGHSKKRPQRSSYASKPERLHSVQHAHYTDMHTCSVDLVSVLLPTFVPISRQWLTDKLVPTVRRLVATDPSDRIMGTRMEEWVTSSGISHGKQNPHDLAARCLTLHGQII